MSSDVLKGYDLKTLKPHYPGVTTQIFDRNGNLLARIPSIAEPDPGAVERDLALAEDGDGRRRGQALLPARRRRLPGRAASRLRGRHGRRRRAGRIDDRAAARPKRLPDRRAVAHQEAPRGVSRDADGRPVVEGQDPHDLPQHDPLRPGHVRLRGGGRRLTSTTHCSQPQPRPGGADRRACRSRRPSTTRGSIPRRRRLAETRCSPRCMPRGTSRWTSSTPRRARGLGLKKPTKSTRIRQPYFVEYVRASS